MYIYCFVDDTRANYLSEWFHRSTSFPHQFPKLDWFVRQSLHHREGNHGHPLAGLVQHWVWAQYIDCVPIPLVLERAQ